MIEVDLTLADCMDLLDNDWNEALKEAPAQFYAMLEELPERDRKRLVNMPPVNRLDCAFFNYLVSSWKRQGKDIKCIRAAASEGAPILPSSPICLDSHVQIAIIDPELISRPRVVYLEE